MRIFLTIRVLFFFICSISLAQQGNYKFNNFGNRSILLSGNVTGSVSDIGLTYYNLARLTEVEGSGFEINAQAYQLSSIDVSNVFVNNTNLNSTKFNSLPSMAGGTFELFGTRFGYAFISKSRSNINIGYSSDILRDEITELFPDADRYRLYTNLRTEVRDNWYGITWAKKLSEKLSLGISLFGSNFEYSGGSNLSHTIASPNSTSFYQNIIAFSQKSYGLFVKLGANYQFDSFSLGMNINLPYIEIYSDGEFDYNKIISGVGSEFDQFYNYDLNGLNAQRNEPLGISVGAGVPLGKSMLHLNVDYVNGTSLYSRVSIPAVDTGEPDLTPINFVEERREVVNFGAGLEIFINERIKSYLGFSSDFSAFGTDANLFDLSSKGSRDVSLGEDFWHYSFGLDLKFNFATIILGATYTKGSSEFVSPSDITRGGFDSTNNTLSKIQYSRWLFVAGLEIPVLQNKFKL